MTFSTKRLKPSTEKEDEIEDIFFLNRKQAAFREIFLLGTLAIFRDDLCGSLRLNPKTEESQK